MRYDKQIKVSVVTVVRNAAETLSRTLESVSSQSYSNIEHILIDGASTDLSFEIAKSFSHLAQMVSEPDRGIYDAMNKGLALATGDVVVFLNADDFFVSNDAIASAVEIIASEDLDVLSGNVAYFRPGKPSKVVRLYDSSHFNNTKLENGLMPAHPGLFVRRQLLQEAGGFNASYRVAGDFELMAKMLTNNPELRLKHFPRVLVKMQLGGASTFDLRTRWRINQELLRACRENGIKTNMMKLMMRYPRKLLEYVCLKR